MDQVEVIPSGSMIVGLDGKIVAVGPEVDIAAKFADAKFRNIVDAEGLVVLPGLVDGHTHPVWSGDRVNEFKMKLAGATYMDIHKMGGGIGYTVQQTRDAPETQLLESFLERLDGMLSQGSTLIEAKSGYGLDLETEMKQLRVLEQGNRAHPIDIVANYCGAHSVPKGSTAQAACRDIVDRVLPAVLAAKAKGDINPELIDVFCEKGVFELKESREILEAGKAAGLHINIHGDELNPIKAAEMASEIGALAVSHLEHVSEEGITAMAKHSVVATLLPTTAYVLRIEPPPARTMIEAGVPVALGSDYNPNAHCFSMPFVMNLACVLMKMTVNEALNAATINAAASLNRSETHGSFEVGKQGDFLLLRANSWEHLIYQLVTPPIEAVYKNGEEVFRKALRVTRSSKKESSSEEPPAKKARLS